VIAGYSETFGIMCMDAEGNEFRFNPWSVSQSALDCTGKIAAANTVISDLTVDYDSSSSGLVPVTAGYSSFF
jgi:hypothetical protein